MASIRVLASVAHDVAHHAASSVSWLHPHAFQHAQAVKCGELHFDLASATPLGRDLTSEELFAASLGLHEKFVEILEKHGFAAPAVTRAQLTMLFPTRDPYYRITACRLETPAGRVFEKSCTSAT